jgi:hypothetical protein
VSQVRATRPILGVLVLAAVVVAIVLAAGSRSDDGTDAGDTSPAQVEPVKGSDVSRVILTAQAARRIGIRTASISRGTGRRTVMPYDAVLYAADGSTFTYTSPSANVFVRSPIRVADIRGDRAVLSSGPPVGTAVVTVGSQELFGTEYEVEED